MHKRVSVERSYVFAWVDFVVDSTKIRAHFKAMLNSANGVWKSTTWNTKYEL